MSRIAWSDAMATGIPSIDAQHRQLVETLQELDQEVHGSHPPQELINRTLDTLLDYVKTHFAHEETLFRACGYPDADAHAVEHTSFTRRVEDLCEIFRNGGSVQASDLVRILSRWIEDHILRTDRGYITCVRQQEGPG